MSVAADGDKVFRETGIRDPRTQAAESKAKRELAALNPQLDAMHRETEHRKTDRLNRVGAQALEVKTATSDT